jgi:hypothetical protein
MYFRTKPIPFPSRNNLARLARRPLQLIFEDVGRHEHFEFANFDGEPELLAHNGCDEA